MPERIYRPGDKVIVLSGECVEDYGPGWVRDMDEFVGRVMTVRRLCDVDNNWVKLEEDSYGWSFDAKYLDPVEDYNTDNCNLEQIDDFVNEFA